MVIDKRSADGATVTELAERSGRMRDVILNQLKATAREGRLVAGRKQVLSIFDTLPTRHPKLPLGPPRPVWRDPGIGGGIRRSGAARGHVGGDWQPTSRDYPDRSLLTAPVPGSAARSRLSSAHFAVLETDGCLLCRRCLSSGANCVSSRYRMSEAAYACVLPLMLQGNTEAVHVVALSIPRLMAHSVDVTTRKRCNPVTLFVKMETGYALFRKATNGY